MYPYHNPYYRVVNRIEEERGERRESKISCVFRPEFSFRGTEAFRGGGGEWWRRWIFNWKGRGEEGVEGRTGRKRHRGWLNGYRHRERRKPLEPATKVCTRLILNVNLHHICMHHRAYPRLTPSTPGLNTSLIAVYISLLPPPAGTRRCYACSSPFPRPGHVWNLVIRRLILSFSFRIDGDPYPFYLLLLLLYVLCCIFIQISKISFWFSWICFILIIVQL